MILRREPLKRTALKPPTVEQLRAWNNRDRKPIDRGSPPARVGRKMKREQAALALGRAVTIARSGGFCEGPEAVGVHPASPHGATHVHHVLSRARGGTHDPSNLLHLCTQLHGWAHANPRAATELGLLASRHPSTGIV